MLLAEIGEDTEDSRCVVESGVQRNNYVDKHKEDEKKPSGSMTWVCPRIDSRVEALYQRRRG